MKAIILSRVSSGHQDLEQQTVKVKEQAMKDGYLEDDIIIIEDVESAVKLSEEERNGLNRMKEVIMSQPVDCVYTYEISRISRQAKIVYSIRDFLEQHHVQLVVMNPFFRMLKDDGTLSETSNLFFGIFSSLAENEGYLRKSRIKKAVDKYRAMGRHTGGNIQFGYKTNYNHEYEVDEVNGSIVREIFEMYVNERMSIRKIAKEMYERGLQMWTCKTDRKPTTYLTMQTNINNILHRKEYYGAVKGKPAIISKQLFDEAQDIMKDRIICTERKHTPSLLKGMIYDKDNGFLLSGNSATKYYYSKRASGVSISYECADKIIIDFVNSYIEEWTKGNNVTMLADLRREYDLTWQKEETLRQRKEEVFLSINRLEERIVLGKISSELGDKLEKKLRDEVDELIELGNRNFSRRITLTNRMANIERSKPKMITDDMKQEEKKDIIKTIIDRIYISRESRTIATLEIITKTFGTKVLRIDSYHKKIL